MDAKVFNWLLAIGSLQVVVAAYSFYSILDLL